MPVIRQSGSLPVCPSSGNNGQTGARRYSAADLSHVERNWSLSIHCLTWVLFVSTLDVAALPNGQTTQLPPHDVRSQTDSISSPHFRREGREEFFFWMGGIAISRISCGG